MGGALVALGLLNRCHWDNDEIYHPKRIGTYLWADSILYFLPAEMDGLTLLQKARAIAADGHVLAALAWDGTSLAYYDPGGTTPTKSLLLPAPCLTVAPKPETAGFLLGGGEGLWEVSPDHRLKALGNTPTLSLLSHASFILAQASSTTITPRSPQTPHIASSAFSLPGPLQSWWIESPNAAAGTFRYRDTLYAFGYQSFSRLLTIDTSRPVMAREKATSPYVTRRWGTEYTGVLSLSFQGTLAPFNIPDVQCFAVDFLGGYLYYVRSDTLWEKNLHTGVEHLRATSFTAQRIKAIGAYNQGRAKTTTR